MKCVMIINEELPLGLIANTAAVLAMSVGEKIKGIIGPDVQDKGGENHSGITRLPIPLLRGNSQSIAATRQALLKADPAELYFVDFCDVAQKCKDYDDYIKLMSEQVEEQLQYLGLAICGPDKLVKSLTGQMGLLR
ncbi:MAG: DUF2000 domain-containing protein [Anaerolineae bacterium]|nr:DUF2000 domain-containing protein [Anaerolineae bacterium]